MVSGLGFVEFGLVLAVAVIFVGAGAVGPVRLGRLARVSGGCASGRRVAIRLASDSGLASRIGGSLLLA